MTLTFQGKEEPTVIRGAFKELFDSFIIPK